jgi:hypothetical protein
MALDKINFTMPYSILPFSSSFPHWDLRRSGLKLIIHLIRYSEVKDTMFLFGRYTELFRGDKLGGILLVYPFRIVSVRPTDASYWKYSFSDGH